MKLTVFSIILMLCAYSFNVNAGGKGIWFTQAMQTTATKVGNVAGKVKSAAGMALVFTAACLNFTACDVNTSTEQINKVIEDGKLVSSDYVDLDTHRGIILVERGGLLTMQATPHSITTKIIDVAGIEVLQENGDLLLFEPEIEETFLTKVQLAILDGAGEAIEGALMMWHRPELQAKQVGDVAVFEQLFVPVYLPAEAQLYMTGAARGDGDGYYFDIATLEPSGIDLTIGEFGFVIETFPPIHGSFLNYEPSIAGSMVDWYIHVWGDIITEPKVSEVMPLQSYLGRPAVLMHQSNPFFKNLPDHYRLVTRVTTKGEGEDTVVIAIVD